MRKKANKEGKSRATRSATAKMPKIQPEETEDSDLEPMVGKMTLLEQREEARREVEELKLEQEIRELHEERDRLLEAKDKQRRRKTREDSGVRTEEAAAGASSKMAMEDNHLCSGEVDSGYSTYGRARKRSRERRRRRRSSSSSSPDSLERKLKSKWSLKKFVDSKKDCKKLNCYEIVCATAAWVLEIPEMSVTDHRAMWEHVYFLSYRARYNEYMNSAHADYDLAIRKLAEKRGFEAFSSAHTGKSVLLYAPGTVNKKQFASSAYDNRKHAARGGKQNNACYAWNSERGCSRKEEDCRYEHKCSKCGGKGHKRVTCKD